MYKLQIMIKKSADEELKKTFQKSVLNNLEKASGQKINEGEIIGAKLMEEPYSHSYELIVDTKEEMDKILVSPDGKKFNRGITSFAAHISIFFIETGE